MSWWGVVGVLAAAAALAALQVGWFHKELRRSMDELCHRIDALDEHVRATFLR